MIVIATPFGTAVFEEDALRSALKRGAELAESLKPVVVSGNGTPEVEPLLTSEELAEKTSVPASWWEEQTRRGAVPVHVIGRYKRYLLSEVIQASAVRERLDGAR